VNEVSREIIDHYEVEIDEASRITSGLGRLELLRTQEIVRRYLRDSDRRVLDVGGAAGVHARWLADEGRDVHVIDPVARHVLSAQQLTSTGGVVTAELGDARALPVSDTSFDAVLMLGPLYHLTERGDRVLAWSEARRAVRPGGVVIAAAISRYASLFDGLAHSRLIDSEFRSIVDADLLDGQHRNEARRPGWFTTAYFHHPSELLDECRDAGLVPLAVLGVEGLAGWLDDLADRFTELEESIMFSARAVEAEPSLIGLSPHLLAIARCPR
jgi:2-polyprenyl-3-methyl-5-hydroxy-6-metoxy-1,4-benzoquinol methylase